MGWTYDAAHLEIPLNQVRFLIGDTVADDPLIAEDGEIAFCLAQKGTDVYLAGAFALRRAATRLTREAGVGSGSSVTIDPIKQAEDLIKRAIDLETEAAKQSGGGLYFGGISKADVEARESNTDAVQPSFKTHTMQQPALTGEMPNLFYESVPILD